MSSTRDPVTYELADVGTRFLALLIDGIILGAVTGILVGGGRDAGAGLSFIINLAYHWYFLTRQNGQTLGKQVMKIRVVKVDGTPISDGDAIIRYIGYIINSAVAMIGWLWAFWDDKKQGWHDKLARTYVIKVG